MTGNAGGTPFIRQNVWSIPTFRLQMDKFIGYVVPFGSSANAAQDTLWRAVGMWNIAYQSAWRGTARTSSMVFGLYVF